MEVMDVTPHSDTYQMSMLRVEGKLEHVEGKLGEVKGMLRGVMGQIWGQDGDDVAGVGQCREGKERGKGRGKREGQGESEGMRGSQQYETDTREQQAQQVQVLGQCPDNEEKQLFRVYQQHLGATVQYYQKIIFDLHQYYHTLYHEQPVAQKQQRQQKQQLNEEDQDPTVTLSQHGPVNVDRSNAGDGDGLVEKKHKNIEGKVKQKVDDTIEQEKEASIQVEEEKKLQDKPDEKEEQKVENKMDSIIAQLQTKLEQSEQKLVQMQQKLQNKQKQLLKYINSQSNFAAQQLTTMQTSLHKQKQQQKLRQYETDKKITQLQQNIRMLNFQIQQQIAQYNQKCQQLDNKQQLITEILTKNPQLRQQLLQMHEKLNCKPTSILTHAQVISLPILPSCESLGELSGLDAEAQAEMLFTRVVSVRENDNGESGDGDGGSEGGLGSANRLLGQVLLVPSGSVEAIGVVLRKLGEKLGGIVGRVIELERGKGEQKIVDEDQEGKQAEEAEEEGEHRKEQVEQKQQSQQQDKLKLTSYPVQIKQKKNQNKEQTPIKQQQLSPQQLQTRNNLQKLNKQIYQLANLLIQLCKALVQDFQQQLVQQYMVTAKNTDAEAKNTNKIQGDQLLHLNGSINSLQQNCHEHSSLYLQQLFPILKSILSSLPNLPEPIAPPKIQPTTPIQQNYASLLPMLQQIISSLPSKQKIQRLFDLIRSLVIKYKISQHSIEQIILLKQSTMMDQSKYAHLQLYLQSLYKALEGEEMYEGNQDRLRKMNDEMSKLRLELDYMRRQWGRVMGMMERNGGEREGGGNRNGQKMGEMGVKGQGEVKVSGINEDGDKKGQENGGGANEGQDKTGEQGKIVEELRKKVSVYEKKIKQLENLECLGQRKRKPNIIYIRK